MAKSTREYVAEANTVVPRITYGAAKEMIETKGALVVDVREPAELAQSGKIPGAVNVPRGMLESRADPESTSHDAAFDKQRPVLVYCASGGRSALAAKLLKEMGYAEVHDIGGFKDWIDGGGAVEKV